MTIISSIVLKFHKLGVSHQDLELKNIMNMGSRDNPSQTDIVFIDFGMAKSPNISRGNPFLLRGERAHLYSIFLVNIGAVETLRWLESMVASKSEDPEWVSFLVDMDPRRLGVWRPLEQVNWDRARFWDEFQEKALEKPYCRYVSASSSQDSTSS